MVKKTILNLSKNLIRLILLLIAVCIISFSLVSLSPVDPVQSYIGAGVSVSPEQRENIKDHWGLDKSFSERFMLWGKSIAKGDFGVSAIYRRPVLNVIKERFISSLSLMAMAWVLSGIIGFTLGIVMGSFKDKLPDKAIKTLCLTLSSTPTFWIGLLFLMLFSIKLSWFPVGLSVPIGTFKADVNLTDRLYHMVLPALTLSISSFSNIALHTREKLIEVLESDYALFARARGENKKEIVKNHGIRNIVLPAITLQFAAFSELFGGSILVEEIFSYPGLGRAVIDAGLKSDIPLLLGITIFSTIFVFTGNFIGNIIYSIVDPRIRESRVNE